MKSRAHSRIRSTAYRHVAASPAGVEEASDVVRVSGDRFLSVGDLRHVATWVDLSGGTHGLVLLPGIPSGDSRLEGVSYNEATHELIVSAEEDRKLYVYNWDFRASADARLRHIVDVPWGGQSNKGIVGLAHLPSRFSPLGRDGLLVLKEGDPRTLGLFDGGVEGKLLTVKLDDGVLDALSDFSGVTVHPQTGHVWIASDESARAVELELIAKGDGVAARLLHVEDLVDRKGRPLKRVEGIAFSESGELLVLTENEALLHRYRLQQ